MQLDKLEIKGFKSFGDKITINFNEGVTAIVGPNGCGKSNVVDAIRWVLGEQSTRMLRSEKMENIIFNGTKTRKPANLAEVSLTFDNTKNILPTAFSSVTVTRKLYRTGESEYRLNDVLCRLKDITDLFLDTGIGADSYSIIELKMIDEIIANKEGSRRNLFEEASGISKYKLRKKQTFSKLKDTETDLSRVEDLLFEIEKNLKTLENQAKKAEKYYRLKEQYKILSLVLASFKISNFRTALNSLEKQEVAQNTARHTVSVKLDGLDAEIQKHKFNSLTKEKNLSNQQKATNDFVSKIRAYESEKKIKNEQLRFLQDKENRLSEELEKDKNQLQHVHYNIKRLNEDHLQEEQLLHRLNLSLQDLKEEVDELRLQQQSVKANLDAQQKQNTLLQTQLYQSEKEIDILSIQKEALTQESRRNIEDTVNRETELNEFNIAVIKLETQIETKKHVLTHLQSQEEDLKQQIIDTEETLAANKDELNQSIRKVDAKQNEFNLTKSLVDNLEGFPESIRFLKKNAQWNKNAPLLSDILFCKEDFRIAIENFLEPLMNHYVVETYQDAIDAIKLLSNASRGKANFFILDRINTETFTEPLKIDYGIPALEVVETEKKYQLLSRHLLQNVFLVNDEQEKNLNTEDLPNGLVLIGNSGKFYKTNYTLSGGSVGLFEGKRIGRAKNLDNLTKSIKTLETGIKSLKAQIEEQTIKVASLKAASKNQEIQLLEKDTTLLQNEFISVKTKQEQYLAFIQNSQNRKQDIENKLNSISNSLIDLTPKIMELKLQKQNLDVQLLNQQQSYTELSEFLTVKSSAYNTENLKFHQQQNKVSGIDKDLEYRESQQESLEIRVLKNQSELEKTKADILGIVQHVDHNDDDLLAMYAQKEEMEKAVLEAEKDYYESKNIINDLESSLSELRKARELFDLQSTELKDKKNQLKLELSSLKERLSVEFSINIEDLLDDEPSEEDNEEEVKEKIEKIKRNLDDFGAINPMAMEAYKEMEDRYTFIQNQKKDLTEAKLSLMQTIKEIDDTAKEKFMTAFVMVRENFMKVFRSLFNDEDSCDLILTNPNEPLESDIDIIARPKGKRPLSINQLSGGEKTLTATALLFSLYLLKPAPFCIFDEVDAPLDDTNIDKFNNIIRTFSGQSQFIVVSHNKKTIASTDIIYGVTMVEQGVSRVVAVDLREVA
ncbi:chromosome segregation protein SMC [Pedobacter cryophilus]|uniref:Chromosome partition protein Smc n=1 Tax=Pedobacter cryophilus TaxID=2571271 RepID=A0A4U1BZN5_9SPHI|nr:chromosome segregation protein SMC [Pedobacter cryophilus]TKB96047.1 chromosome segregation protein SMC [Pedobacter cryophilus]